MLMEYLQIVDPHTIDVDGKLYSARHILISVGGRPFIPEIPGSEYAIDSDAALDLPSKPLKKHYQYPRTTRTRLLFTFLMDE